MISGRMRVVLILAAPLLLAIAAFPQRFGFQRQPEGPRMEFPPKGEFHFIRVEYTDLPQYHRGF